jgi:PAS domain S-box-containing protein
LFLAAALCIFLSLLLPCAAARDVRVAIHEIPPSYYTDGNGQPAGIFADMVRDIAAREGWNVTWVHGTFAENWARLAAGEIDFIPGVVDIPEREKTYDFNREPVFSAWSQVYALPGSGISTILDLEGRRVAVLKGDSNGIAFHDFATKFGVNITYVERETLDGTFAGPRNGDADAVVAFSMGGEDYARKYGLSLTTVMFNPSSFRFAVPKGKNADLLVAVDRYIAEGNDNPVSDYSRTMQKWFGPKTSGWRVPAYFWQGLVAVGGLAALFVIMSIFLRREVRRTTAELAEQNEELQSEIASRRHAEQELADEVSRRRILIDQSRDGIVILDQDGRVFEANRSFATMLGYSWEEMQQLHVWDWDAQIRKEDLHEMIRTIDASGDHFETRHRRKDGTVIDVDISTNAAEFSGRKLIFCVVRESTERKRAEEQLKTVNTYLQDEVTNRTRAEAELVRKNEELNAAYRQLAATEENLRVNYDELKRSETALAQARKKLSVLNRLTFQDIQNGFFTLGGYLQLAKASWCSDETKARLDKGEEILQAVRDSLDLARKYQDLGISQPRWQGVSYVLINAISHLDFSKISRTVALDDLEIYADPLLEDVFLTLMKNVLAHGEGATTVRIGWRRDEGGIAILVEDNGPGIPAADKERIFAREYTGRSGTSLFLAREILSITGISIRESGTPGEGARFEIIVPEGGFQFRGTPEKA